MVLQVAAATNCKHYYGVEKADIPATYAEVTTTIRICTPLNCNTLSEVSTSSVTAANAVLAELPKIPNIQLPFYNAHTNTGL